MHKAFDYLERAEECRKIANQMRNPQHKERLEGLKNGKCSLKSGQESSLEQQSNPRKLWLILTGS